MRGKVWLRFCQLWRFRITPAYAGKSVFPNVLDPFRQDHPRLCGEKRPWLSVATLPPGSPPPMRGKEERESASKLAGGITPAYAGKSTSDIGEIGESGDHPRLCGEKNNRPTSEADRQGSPPPMRGKGGSGFSLTSTYRITPAYAGKSDKPTT